MAGRLFRKHDRPSVAIQRAALLQGMHLYYVKYYGKEEVPEARGEKVVDYALHRILTDRRERKREGIKSARVELSISTTGIKVTDRSTGHIFLDIPLSHVSYCQDDRRGNNSIFCFIAKETLKAPKCCYAFKSHNQAGEIMNTIGSCFTRVKNDPSLARPKGKSGPGASASSSAAPPQQRQASVNRARPANAAQHAKVTQMRGRPGPSFRNPPTSMSTSSSSSAAAETRDLEREMKDMEKNFESDFKFAMARASVKTKPTDGAFGAKSPAPATNLPAVSAGAFHEQTTVAPSQSGFDDSFIKGKPATPAAPKHNPYARKRGEAPPAQLAVKSQIHVPDEFKQLRPKKRTQQQQQQQPSDLDDDDFFAEIAATRQPKAASPQPATEAAPTQQQQQQQAAEEAPPPPSKNGGDIASPSASRETPFGFDDFDPRAETVTTSAAAMHDDGVTVPHDDGDESDQEVDALLEQLTTDLHNDEYEDDDAEKERGVAAPAAVSGDEGDAEEQQQQQEEGEEEEEEEEREDEHKAVGSKQTEGTAQDEAAWEQAAVESASAKQEAGEEEEDEDEDEDEEMSAEEMPIVKLCQHVWSLSTPDEEDCVDGGQMRQFMTMSQLPTSTLGLIWSMVDTEQRGKLDYRQLGFVLGLMGQAQRNEELDPSVIGPNTQPPELHGLPPIDEAEA